MPKTILQTAIFLLLVIVSQTIVLAGDNHGVFTVYPSHKINNSPWIIAEANVGINYKNSITVENLTNQKINISLNFREMIGEKESAKIIEDNNFKNIGNWIKLDQSNLELNPYEKKPVTFNINVPANTVYGDYQGTILATNINSASPSLNIATRIGTRVYLNVNNNKNIQNNFSNLDLGPTQITILALSTLGLLYGLKKEPEK